MRIIKLSIFFVTLALLSSCNAISSLVHDDEVIAKVGKSVLYRSELETVVPNVGPLVSVEDSSALAQRYIYSWAMDMLYINVAESMLSKEEMDVSRELESYRNTLIKYRYEQRYVADRLDTLVTDDQIEVYYELNKEKYKIVRPLVKSRFVDIMKDSPNYKAIQNLISSDDYDDLAQVDSLASASALRYFDQSDVWMDSKDLAKLFDMDYNAMLSKVKNKLIVVEPEDRGDVLIAYISDIIKTGYMPVDYCSLQIKDIIISNRKNALLKDLEQDLLKNALESKQLEIIK